MTTLHRSIVKRSRSFPAALLAAVGLALACDAEPDSHPIQRPPPSAPPSAPDPSVETVEGFCSLAARERHYLELEPGLQLFVEPRVVGPFGDAVLVAGQPIYEIDRAGDAEVTVRAVRAYFGVLVRGDSVETIGLPPGVQQVGWVHGVRLGEERWGFVFEEVRGTEPELEVLRALSAELDGTGWGPLEELPSPARERGRVAVPLGSNLAVDTLGIVWSTLLTGGEVAPPVITYRREDEGWRLEERRSLSAEVLDLRPSAAGPTSILVAGLDPDPLSTPSTRSLRLYRSPHLGDPPTTLHRTRAVITAVHSSAGSQGLQVAWLQQGAASDDGAWFLADALDRSGPTPIHLDPHAWMLRPGGIVGRWSIWATQTSGLVTHTSRMRIYRSSGDGTVETLVDLPTPFTGPFSLTLSPLREIVVVGPEAHTDSTTPFVRSLVLRYSYPCDTATAADHLQGP